MDRKINMKNQPSALQTTPAKYQIAPSLIVESFDEEVWGIVHQLFLKNELYEINFVIF